MALERKKARRKASCAVFLATPMRLPSSSFRRDLDRFAAALAGKAAGRLEIAVGEIDLGQRLRRDRVRGDDGVGLAAPQGQQQLAPRAHLDVAGGVELQADGARQIDVEADQHAVLVVEVEGREVAFGQEAHDDALASARRHRPRLPAARPGRRPAPIRCAGAKAEHARASPRAPPRSLAHAKGSGSASRAAGRVEGMAWPNPRSGAELRSRPLW